MSPLVRWAIRVSGKAKAGGGLQERRRQLGGVCWCWRVRNRGGGGRTAAPGEGLRMEKATKKARRAWEQRQASETMEQESWSTGENDMMRKGPKASTEHSEQVVAVV